LVTVPERLDSLPKTMSTEDRVSIDMIKEHCGRLVQYEHAMRDDVARSNNLRRDRDLEISPQVTRFDLRVGDEVSFDGNKVAIKALSGALGQPQTAVVTLGSGKEKSVQFRDLRPLGVERPRERVPK
jgi:hypothetical protein